MIKIRFHFNSDQLKSPSGCNGLSLVTFLMLRKFDRQIWDDRIRVKTLVCTSLVQLGQSVKDNFSVTKWELTNLCKNSQNLILSSPSAQNSKCTSTIYLSWSMIFKETDIVFIDYCVFKICYFSLCSVFIVTVVQCMEQINYF